MTTSKTVQAIPGYPTVALTSDGEQVTIRLMVPEDKDALLEFFRRIPEEDRFYLKEDVTSATVIGRWADNLDYSRALPLLAISNGRIVADGTLHFRRAGARRHVGEVRVVVDPEYRNRAIGRMVLRKLAEIARYKGLKKLVAEVVAVKEEAAEETARVLGFTRIAVLTDHIRDINGESHDLVILEQEVRKRTPDSTTAPGTP